MVDFVDARIRIGRTPGIWVELEWWLNAESSLGVRKERLRDLNKNKLMLALASAVVTSCGIAGYAMDSGSSNGSVHAEITRDALNGVLSPDNLKAVIDANDSLDAPNGDGASEKRRHFDVTAMTAAVQYINREKNKALTFASEADTEPESRADALRHFGLMLHTVQDFYLRSNYLEMQLEKPESVADPYNIGLVDWTKVPESLLSASGNKLTAANKADPVDPLNKDAATTPGGSKMVSGGITRYAVAKDLATRETQRQWNLFETLIRNRCGNRGPAVLAALRQASTPTPAQAAAAKERETQTIVGDPKETPDLTTDDMEP